MYPPSCIIFLTQLHPLLQLLSKLNHQTLVRRPLPSSVRWDGQRRPGPRSCDIASSTGTSVHMQSSNTRRGLTEHCLCNLPSPASSQLPGSQLPGAAGSMVNHCQMCSRLRLRRPEAKSASLEPNQGVRRATRPPGKLWGKIRDSSGSCCLWCSLLLWPHSSCVCPPLTQPPLLCVLRPTWLLEGCGPGTGGCPGEHRTISHLKILCSTTPAKTPFPKAT